MRLMGCPESSGCIRGRGWAMLKDRGLEKARDGRRRLGDEDSSCSCRSERTDAAPCGRLVQQIERSDGDLTRFHPEQA